MDKETGFISHLAELRKRLIHSLIFLSVLFVICYFFSEYIYGFLVNPYAEAVRDDGIERRLIFTALQETFLTYLKVSFFAAFFITSPFILIQIWKFIAPGLYTHEKKAIMPYLIITPILFLLGGMLVYYLIMPLAIKFFLSFESLGASTNLPIQLEAKVNEYLSLVMKLIFAFGLSFQLPVVLSLLARIGVINSTFLKERRKYVVVMIFAAAAILTPPDPITQIGLAVPLLILYELSIFSVNIIEKKAEEKMHNLKEIRENLEYFKKSLSHRNSEVNYDQILDLDKKNRQLIQEKEKFEMEKKNISKSKDESLFEKSKEISKQIENLSKKQKIIKNELDNLLSSIPNLPLDEVPVGKDENDNVEVTKSGEIKDFKFKPLSHYELGEKLNMLDFDLATKTTGSRFVFVKDKLAALERAISNFMIDTHIQKNGYTEISPPLMATDETMFGTGQLPKFENDQFEIKFDDKNDRKFLIPTAEVILTNMVKNQIIDKKKLPMRLVASTPCFRKEAGSYGKDTKGMIRQHQFYKVELVSIVENNQCMQELERMTECATKILDDLKLPYRKIILCTGDMGFGAEKTYDLEVWLPSENKYREISSCSSCGSFQARRMKARYKNKDNNIEFVGTLNGSGLAVGRTLIAILENYQLEDGSIIIPEVLKPYMGNIDKISNN